MTMSILIAQMSPGETVGLYALPLIGSVMLAYAIYNLVNDLRSPEIKRVTERLRDDGMSDSANELAAKASILRNQKGPTKGLSGVLGRLGFVPRLQLLLEQADINMTAAALLLYTVGASAVAYIICNLMRLPLWVGLTASGVMLVAPSATVFVIRMRRFNKFMNQLPDVFELMGQGLRAGHSLPNAILLIAQQLPNPVGKEFARVFHEQNLGIKVEDALKNLAQRISMMDVKFFVTAVLIQRQTGGDLAEVLDNISHVIRDRIKLFGTVKALTAEGRLSGWVLLALPIVVFVMELVVNPKYANTLLDTEIGNYMLIGAGIAQFLGLCMIQKIVNIKV